MNLAVALSFSLKFRDAKYSRIVCFLNLNLRVRCCHYSQKIRLRNYLFRIRIRQTSVQRYLAQVSCPYCLFYSVADPDPVGSGTFSQIRIRNYQFRIRIQQKVKEHTYKTVNSELFYYWTVVLNREGQIFVKILLLE